MEDWLTDLLENAASTLYCDAVPTPEELVIELEQEIVENFKRNLNNKPTHN